MNKDLDQSPDKQEMQADSAPAEETAGSRRRFTRDALMGSAVIFSLANRSAWGQSEHADDTCMSATMLTSFVANGNQFASLRPGQSQEAAKAEEILRPSNNATRHSHGNKTCVKP